MKYDFFTFNYLKKHKKLLVSDGLVCYSGDEIYIGFPSELIPEEYKGTCSFTKELTQDNIINFQSGQNS